jgi:hypothetical protein
MTEVQDTMLRIRKTAKKRQRGHVPSVPVEPPAAPELAEEMDAFADSTDFEHPAVRPLKAYAFDPSEGRYLGNEMTLNVRYERLVPGPIGRRIGVIDYDGAKKVFYKPVDLDHPNVMIRGGVPPSESDPRFHQQMVYAVASETVQHFDLALGRRIHWRIDERLADANGQVPRGRLPGDIDRLLLFPHAMVAANAAYVPSAKGILFGYFRASETEPGNNLPGQTVFTCLSHDIIVHETTHAVLDGMRTYFSEPTNADVPAFHEAFADLAALFRHFAHKEALLDTIQKTGGQLYKYQLQPDAVADDPDETRIVAEIGTGNPLIALARQFGEARGTGRALRSALSIGHDPKQIKDARLDPHDRGSILVSAVFDAYFTVYMRQTADLFRLFRAGGGSVYSVELPSEMANMLAATASRTAEYFFQICVRAIDYCPPIDITFGDYLRAVITADRELHPTDELGVRDAIMQAFRLRGIVPASARYFSEDALCWQGPESKRLPAVTGLLFGDPNGLEWGEKNHNGVVLRAYADANRTALGFRAGLPVSVPSFHPMFRVDPDGSLRVDMVVEMCQSREAHFDPDRPELGTFPMRAGVTLLIRKLRPWERTGKRKSGGEPDTNTISYLIHKWDREDGNAREQRQRAYCLERGLLEGTDPKRFQLDFNLLHGSLL